MDNYQGCQRALPAQSVQSPHQQYLKPAPSGILIDLGLKAELVRKILESLPKEEVLPFLPQTAESLQALSSLGQESMADYLQNWQQAQAARLKHLQIQLTQAQLEVVEEALSSFLGHAKATQGDSPNTRGTALFLLCQEYLKERIS